MWESSSVGWVLIGSEAKTLQRENKIGILYLIGLNECSLLGAQKIRLL
jgi:hypothetical protein